MLSEEATLISPLLQSRTRVASVWLARSRVTASCLMKAMMGKSCLTIHSAAGGNLLFSLDWSGPLIVVKGGDLESPYRFHDLKSATTFFDAVLLNHVVSPSEARSAASDLLECGTP